MSVVHFAKLFVCMHGYIVMQIAAVRAMFSSLFSFGPTYTLLPSILVGQLALNLSSFSHYWFYSLIHHFYIFLMYIYYLCERSLQYYIYKFFKKYVKCWMIILFIHQLILWWSLTFKKFCYVLFLYFYFFY